MQVVPSPALVARLFKETYEFPAPFASPEGACQVECRGAPVGTPKVLHEHVVGAVLP